MKFGHIHKLVDSYYSAKVLEHGPTARGVDWNSAESQQLRFRQFLAVCDPDHPFSVNDFGCGYGALYDFLRDRDLTFRYQGFDLSAPMIARATELHETESDCDFTTDPSELRQADCILASGIFNVKLATPVGEWTDYILDTLQQMADLGRRGFAFNMLTSYSDPDRMRPDLYYGDPCFFFDHCKRNFSRHVALLHDYGLYEFTLIVRK